jgi:GNAT superfamily N-acetyltransferase
VSFFEGWRAAPAPDRCLAAITRADACVLAYDCVRVVGFATAFTDHALFAFIPLVEVAASHRARGIGSELVRRIARAFGPIYGGICAATRTPSGSTPAWDTTGSPAWSVKARRRWIRA